MTKVIGPYSITFTHASVGLGMTKVAIATVILIPIATKQPMTKVAEVSFWNKKTVAVVRNKGVQIAR